MDIRYLTDGRGYFLYKFLNGLSFSASYRRCQVWEDDTGRLIVNTTSTEPSFVARPLEPGVTYRALVLAYNSRGSTEPVRMPFMTLEEVAMHKSTFQNMLHIYLNVKSNA